MAAFHFVRHSRGTSMAPEPIRLDAATVANLFNAPDADPFSQRETDILGEAGIDRLLLHLQLHPVRKPADETLIVTLPADQIAPDLQPKLTAAIQRYCATHIEDNQLQIRLSRKQHTVGMVTVLLIALVAIVIAYLLISTLFANASQVVQGMIYASTSVFVWVILWDPLEALLFDWAQPARENRALERLMAMEVAVEAQA